ncbi:MAG: methionyl-tRNA formyltransferase [Chloroflexi bacterium]|nr:methionyl-tRNA formyltransferase [Chloroflexota bacterium]
MRVVFFGSPDYALPTLRGLLEATDVDVVAAVTQPDRPRGRSGKAIATPVKQLADEAGVPVLTPERIRREQTAEIAAFEADAGVLAASAHILPTHLLETFPRGVLNVHASLLPRHRGASPVAAAILAGDAEAGATIMQIVRELDAGPVVGKISTPIEPLDTTATLTDRIAELGAQRLVELLGPWVAGEVEATPQDESLATYAPMLSRADGALDWSRPAEELWRLVRAMQPWPQATTTYGDAPFTVHAAWPVDAPEEAAPGEVCAGDGEPLSELLPGRGARAVVACGEGGLALLRVQRAGRRALEIEDYLNGDRTLIGARLGSEA